MCGRFAITLTTKDLKDAFKIDKVNFEVTPNFNIAPSLTVPVLVKISNELTLDGFRWGLIPSWAEDEKIGYKMINARVETIQEKRTFKTAFEKGRCLILASGFFEWKKTNNNKVPYYIYKENNEPIAFAGISSVCKLNKKTITSCSILTTQPCKEIKLIHDRMPLILKKENYKDYLSNEKLPKESTLVPEAKLKSHIVSNFVNSLKNNSIECIKKAPITKSLSDF